MKLITCKNCKEEKSHEAFGLCKKCYSKQYRQKNRKILARKSKEYYGLKKEERLKYHKEYRSRNKDKIKACQRAHYNQNKDRLSLLHQEYYFLNKGRLSLMQKNRRHKGRVNKVRIEKHGNIQYWVYNTSKFVHTAIAEKVLGRRLKLDECVHHKDENGLNNLHSNLLVCTKSYHAWLHWQTRRRQPCLS